MVGATVLIALGTLGWMILKFSGQVARPFAPTRFAVHFVSDRADGVADGSPIVFRGVEAGNVKAVELSKDNSHVIIRGEINAEPPLPSNLIAIIRTSSLLGTSSSISLELQGTSSLGNLAPNQEIPAKYVGIDLLPPEFGNLAREMELTAKQLRESNFIGNLNEQVTKVGELVASLQKIIDDPNSQSDVKSSLANIKTATETANRVLNNFEKLSTSLDKLSSETTTAMTEARSQISRAGDSVNSVAGKIGDRLTQLATLIEQMQSIAAKIDKGQGTAGQLVNDPRLYEALVDTTREMNATIKDLKRLVEQWEQEGISLKLK